MSGKIYAESVSPAPSAVEEQDGKMDLQCFIHSDDTVKVRKHRNNHGALVPPGKKKINHPFYSNILGLISGKNVIYLMQKHGNGSK